MPGEHPLPDSYWAGSLLLAGPAPGHEERDAQKERLRALLDAGVRCFIDLTTPAEIPVYRVALERLAPAGDEAVYTSVPILDGSAPVVPVTRMVLDMIDAGLRRERAVYIHCRGGLGRTGTIVACWWIRHGLATPDDFQEKLAMCRWGQPNGARPSPETSSQMALVRSWRRGV